MVTGEFKISLAAKDRLTARTDTGLSSTKSSVFTGVGAVDKGVFKAVSMFRGFITHGNR